MHGTDWQTPGFGTSPNPAGEINVFALMDELIAGKLSGDAWVARCNELGINGAPLYNGGRSPTVPSN